MSDDIRPAMTPAGDDDPIREGASVTLPDGYITREDVTRLREAADHQDAENEWPPSWRRAVVEQNPLRSLADRIEALLPPERD